MKTVDSLRSSAWRYALVAFPLALALGTVRVHFHRWMPALLVCLYEVVFATAFWVLADVRRRRQHDRPEEISVHSVGWLSLLAAVECGLVLPSQTYFGNTGEFFHAYREYLVPLAVLCLLIFFLAWSMFGIARRLGYLREGLLVGCILVLGLWVQGNYRLWSGTTLTGGDLSLGGWNAHVLDAYVWLGVSGLVWISRHRVSHWIRKVAPLFILFQLALLLALYVRLPREVEAAKFAANAGDDLFSFSKKRNVIILLLDGFQGTVFSKDVIGRPPAEEIFDGFTYYPNATSAFMSTAFSVPNLISGTIYDNTQPYSQYMKSISESHNLFRTLARAGMATSASWDAAWPFSGHLMAMNDQGPRPMDIRGAWRDIPWLLDVTLFRVVPTVLKSLVYGNDRWFLSYLFKRYGQSAGSIRFPIPACSKASDVTFLNQLASEGRPDSDRPTFKFIHLRTPHPPYDLDENLQARRHGNSLAHYETNTRAALRIAQEFIDGLKKEGVYDPSLIFIVSDHGLGYPANPTEMPVHDGETWTPEQIQAFDFIKGRLLPILLVKDFSAHGPLRISQAPVMVSDVPQTIVDRLGLDADFSGPDRRYRSIFKVNPTDPRVRYSRYYKFPTPDGYMTTAAEFRVTGNSREDSSWHFTHRAFVRDRGLVEIDCPEFEKNNFFVTLDDGNKECYRTAHGS